jgi:hypothetical protein
MVLLGATGQVERSQAMARELAATHPDHGASVYAAVQPQFARAARGAPVDRAALEVIANLPASAQATLRASALLRAGDLTGLSNLDPVLATARWTDPWFGEAVQLRAEWRARVSNPGISHALADEAIAQLDRLGVVQPSLPLHVLRSRAAVTADRPDVLIEALAQVAQWSAALAGNNPAAKPRLQTTMRELLALLDGRDSDSRVDRQRLEEVRAQIRKILEGASS